MHEPDSSTNLNFGKSSRFFNRAYRDTPNPSTGLTGIETCVRGFPPWFTVDFPRSVATLISYHDSLVFSILPHDTVCPEAHCERNSYLTPRHTRAGTSPREVLTRTILRGWELFVNHVRYCVARVAFVAAGSISRYSAILGKLPEKKTDGRVQLMCKINSTWKMIFDVYLHLRVNSAILTKIRYNLCIIENGWRNNPFSQLNRTLLYAQYFSFYYTFYTIIYYD